MPPTDQLTVSYLQMKANEMDLWIQLLVYTVPSVILAYKVLKDMDDSGKKKVVIGKGEINE